MAEEIDYKSIIAKKDDEIDGLNESVADLELYLKDLSEFLPIPVCVISPIGIIVDANRSFLLMSEYHQTDLIGKPIEDVFVEFEQIAKLLKTLEGENPQILQREFSFISKEKKVTAVNLSIAVKRDQENELIGFTIALVDISEHKRFQKELEKQVEEKTKELQQKIEELEKINRLTLKRELKMIELKKQIEELRATLVDPQDRINDNRINLN
ncbi:MAG: PAS domain-containing protein [bacterium]